MSQNLTLTCNVAYVKTFFSHVLLNSLRIQCLKPLPLHPFTEERSRETPGKVHSQKKILQEYFRGIKGQTASAGPNFSVSWVGKLKQREEPVSLKVT